MAGGTFSVTKSWADLVDTVAGAADVDVKIQNTGPHNISVVTKDSGGAPTELGMVFRNGEGAIFNASQIWIKALGPDGKIAYDY